MLTKLSFKCTPHDDNSFTSFTADMEQPIGGGTDHAATITFDDGVKYYKGYTCDVDPEVDPGDISGTIVCEWPYRNSEDVNEYGDRGT